MAEPDGVKAELDNAADSIMSGANELYDSKNVVLGFATEDGFNTFVATSIGGEIDQQSDGQKSAVGENIQLLLLLPLLL